MLGFLAGVPGRLKTMTDRLSATWAAKLDTVAGLVTSTWAAKLDTLASNFTSTISGRIDAAITTRAPDSSPLLSPPMTSGIVKYLPSSGYSQVNLAGMIHSTYPHWTSHNNSADVGTAWTDVVNITGSGVINFAALQNAVNGAIGVTMYMDVILDGVTVISFADVCASPSAGYGPILIGCVGGSSTYGLTPVFEDVPFKTSCQVRVKSSSATYMVRGAVRVRRNS